MPEVPKKENMEMNKNKEFFTLFHDLVLKNKMELVGEDGEVTTMRIVGLEIDGKEYLVPSYNPLTKTVVDMDDPEEVAELVSQITPSIQLGNITGYNSAEEAEADRASWYGEIVDPELTSSIVKDKEEIPYAHREWESDPDKRAEEKANQTLAFAEGGEVKAEDTDSGKDETSLVEKAWKSVPTNVRLFAENLAGKTSKITEEDFTPEEIEELSLMVNNAEQDDIKEEGMLKRTKEVLSQYVPSTDDEEWYGHSTKDGVRTDVTKEDYNKKAQDDLDRVVKDLESFEKTRGKISVDEYFDGAGDDGNSTGSGPTFLKAIHKSFTSPAYNISTTLGRFNAFKNEDGSVTIKDTYNWNREGYKKDVSLRDFLAMVPTMLSHPEAAGNVVMRLLFPEKTREFEINLTSPKERQDMRGYKDGGEVKKEAGPKKLEAGIYQGRRTKS
jgi:hypothetical protein